MRTRLTAWLELCRISNLPTAWTNVLAGWLLAGGGWQDQRLPWLLLGGSLMYCAGMILNDAADAKWDSEHRRERPIPSGRVSLHAAWTGGVGGLMGGVFCMAWLGGADVLWVCLLLLAIVSYDLLHKEWQGSVLVMGACRALLYMAAASPLATMKLLDCCSGLMTDHGMTVVQIKTFAGLPPGLVLHALAIGAYVMGLTMMARNESTGRSQNLLAAFLSRMLLFAPGILAAAWFIRGGDWRMVILIVIFAAMVSTCSRIMRAGGPAIGRAVGILLAGIAVVDALAVATISVPLACLFVAAAPLLRLWQRKIAAT